MFEESERSQALRDAGAVDYLTKSGPPENLVAAIRRCMIDKGDAASEPNPRTQPHAKRPRKKH
jgi:DNA-binding response OmpR family regulator